MEKDLTKLEEELEFVDLDKKDKEAVINVYRSWKTCFDYQIIISNIRNPNKRTRVDIKDSVYIDGVETYKNISKRSTIFFSECENLNISLISKVNHVIIERSNNINLKTFGGIIGGIDVLHSRNINFIVTKEDIFYISFGDVYMSNTYIDKSLALNTLISTLQCNSLNFVHMIDSILENVKYVTNTSIFGGLYMMMFIKNDTGLVELHYFHRTTEGRTSNGIIYPTK